MWDTDEIPDDMPLEEWLWATGQVRKPIYGDFDDSDEE